jgi:hypothetical protein
VASNSALTGFGVGATVGAAAGTAVAGSAVATLNVGAAGTVGCAGSVPAVTASTGAVGFACGVAAGAHAANSKTTLNNSHITRCISSPPSNFLFSQSPALSNNQLPIFSLQLNSA